MFRGTLTAVVTPFHPDGTVDYDTYRRLVARQIEAGISGIVTLGTTGETPTLSADEQKRVIQATVEVASGQVPVLVGVGSNSTQATIEKSVQAEELGAKGLLVVTPYYNKPSDDGLVAHFQAVAQAVSLPIMIYNIPGRTGRNIDVPTMRRLFEIPSVIADKEAAGSVDQAMDMIGAIPKMTLLSGDDALTLPFIAVGAQGVVSVLSNLLPKTMVEYTNAALSGNMDLARELHYVLLPLMRGLFMETNPQPVKYAMARRGLLSETFRLPMTNMRPENKHRLDLILEPLADRS